MLRLSRIDKAFDGRVALRDVSLEARPGRLLFVCGENGAGKSTLLKVGAGLLRPDRGEVFIGGSPLVPHAPAEAIRRGLAMVQQHFALVERFSVLDNLLLGFEPAGRWGSVDREGARAHVEKVLADLGVTLPLDARVETLCVGDRQRIEIARALYRKAKVLILDEPTAVLTLQEAEVLYALLRRMADQGCTIVVVTHHLDEVKAHADDVLVLRRGEVVEARPVDADREGEPVRLAHAMLGTAPPKEETRTASTIKEPLEGAFGLERVSLGPLLHEVSFSVHAGEIVGVAGVEGNGQRELVRVLSRLDLPDSGRVVGPPLGVVHENRQEEGLVLDASLEDNVLLGDFASFARFGWLRRREMGRSAEHRLQRFGIGAPRTLAARGLSGGNQQKLVLSRVLARSSRGLVFAHPTRGVDLGAARAIGAEIARVAREGAGVLVVSADLRELRRMADRILVMSRGRIVRELPPSAPLEEFGQAMLMGAPHG